VNRYRPHYQATKKRSEKHRIVTDIIKEVEGWGGAFLRSETENEEDPSSWLPVSTAVVYEKVSHALRHKKPFTCKLGLGKAAQKRRAREAKRNAEKNASC